MNANNVFSSIRAICLFYPFKQILFIIFNFIYAINKLVLVKTGERLSRIVDLNFDYGLGTFAGLNILPKVAALTQYSYSNPHQVVVTLLKKWNSVLKDKGYIQGRHINLDFHAIPHWGEESQLENHWVSTSGKAMKSVLCFFAQDLDTTYLCYSNGQLSKEDAPDEILNYE
ncbi:MAG: hypothetical protein NUV74_01515 [Candidatus Brocadiaceae bacterium]|nr:hypothetical protein [Candidatus Brocadiaceae bacterium]